MSSMFTADGPMIDTSQEMGGRLDTASSHDYPRLLTKPDSSQPKSILARLEGEGEDCCYLVRWSELLVVLHHSLLDDSGS